MGWGPGLERKQEKREANWAPTYIHLFLLSDSWCHVTTGPSRTTAPSHMAIYTPIPASGFWRCSSHHTNGLFLLFQDLVLSLEVIFQTSLGTSSWLLQLCFQMPSVFSLTLYSQVFQLLVPISAFPANSWIPWSIHTLKSYLTSEPWTVTTFGDRPMKRESSSNEVTTAGPNSIGLPYRKRKFGSTERRPRQGAGRGPAICQPKTEARGSQACSLFDPGLPVSRKYSLLFKPPPSVVFSGSPCKECIS